MINEEHCETVWVAHWLLRRFGVFDHYPEQERPLVAALEAMQSAVDACTPGPHWLDIHAPMSAREWAIALGVDVRTFYRRLHLDPERHSKGLKGLLEPYKPASGHTVYRVTKVGAPQ